MATNNVQPGYATQYAVGYPGMIANGETSNRISRNIEDAAGIPFGRAAFRGAADRGVTAAPSAAGFLGVTIADPSVQPLAGVVAGGAAADIYPQHATAGLLNEGMIWVRVGEAVNDGDPAYVTPAGAFVKATAGNTAIPAVFDDTAASGGMSRLRVRRS